MNKKGIELLGPEVVKLVVTVICLGILIFLLVSVYYSKVNSNKLKQAEAVLKGLDAGSIETIIERVRNNQGNINGSAEGKLVLNPTGWYIFGFTGKKPNSCYGKNCVCLCSGVFVDTLFGIIESRQLGECDEKGTCLIVEGLKESFKIEIEPTNLLIRKQDNLIEVLKNE